MPDRGATHQGVDGVVHALAGRVRRRLSARSLMREAGEVLRLAEGMRGMSEEELDERVSAARAVVRMRRDRGEELRGVLAVVVEVIRRETGLLLHGVQVGAGLAMVRGAVAELATGEGKTLAAVLPAAVAGWRGRGCHVVTANDYLAQRDADGNARVYSRLGLSVACVGEGMPASERGAAYRADVTYSTARELAGDFLRDRLEPARGVQRALAVAIVDEADFVLIDEAATPLILAAPARSRDETRWIREADALGAELREGSDYRADFVRREVTLTGAGAGRVAERFAGGAGGHRGTEMPMRRARELVVAAVRAHRLFERDRDYAVSDGRVLIIDERTGRISQDRRWRDGLHEAIEAKEGLAVNPSDDTLASVSFQRFFCGYPLLSGMTGTARQCAAELWNVYWLRTALLGTHRRVIRERLATRTMADREGAMDAAVGEAMAMRDRGRAVLVATASVDASERVAEKFAERGVDVRVINAVRHREEAEIVARAGRAGAITVATSMAGRGTDIVLDEECRAAGGLHVIALGHQISRRVDRQLFGRAGRQGDPGSTRVIRSAEDDLLVRNAPGVARVLPGGLKFAMTQWMAERRARSARRGVMRRDHSLDDLLAFASGRKPRGRSG